MNILKHIPSAAWDNLTYKIHTIEKQGGKTSWSFRSLTLTRPNPDSPKESTVTDCNAGNFTRIIKEPAVQRCPTFVFSLSTVVKAFSWIWEFWIVWPGIQVVRSTMLRYVEKHLTGYRDESSHGRKKCWFVETALKIFKNSMENSEVRVL